MAKQKRRGSEKKEPALQGGGGQKRKGFIYALLREVTCRTKSRGIKSGRANFNHEGGEKEGREKGVKGRIYPRHNRAGLYLANEKRWSGEKSAEVQENHPLKAEVKIGNRGAKGD